MRILHVRVNRAVRLHRDVLHVTGMRALRVLQAVLFVVGVEVAARRLEVGRIALRGLVKMDRVLAGRKLLAGELDPHTLAGGRQRRRADDLTLRVLELHFGGFRRGENRAGNEHQTADCKSQDERGFHERLLLRRRLASFQPPRKPQNGARPSFGSTEGGKRGAQRYGISRIFPVVFRPSSARCACAASASAYSRSTRRASLPSRIQPSTSPARATSSSRERM